MIYSQQVFTFEQSDRLKQSMRFNNKIFPLAYLQSVTSLIFNQFLDEYSGITLVKFEYKLM
ncbi:hypothetical protein [Trichodesmium erythraeum]|uniref:hypothetical protein n=1 Tax=Trichodesmium erythraeum TaxID=1206 RepID=UPI000316138C|nr:hypothetical protein [Trichodesmium erythraeum GBRTRLIN201]